MIKMITIVSSVSRFTLHSLPLLGMHQRVAGCNALKEGAPSCDAAAIFARSPACAQDVRWLVLGPPRVASSESTFALLSRVWLIPGRGRSCGNADDDRGRGRHGGQGLGE